MQPVLSLAPNSAIPLAKKPVEDENIAAAGLMIVTPQGYSLFLRYASGHENEGEWAFPAGTLEEGEDPETAAIRETREETGWIPQSEVREVNAGQDGENGVSFTTFATASNNQFIPELREEHDAWCWAPLDSPPEPLHEGAQRLIGNLIGQDQKIVHSTAANIASRSELDSIGLPKTQPKSRAINIAYATGGTVGRQAKQSGEANSYINSGGLTEHDRERTGKSKAVLDEFKEADHPRDPDGKFGSEGGSKSNSKEVKTRVTDFVKSGQAKQVISLVTKKALGKVKEHHSELLAGAVTFGLYHIAGADFPMDVEAAVHHEVEHLATNLGVAKVMVVNMMKDVVSGLQGLRKNNGAAADSKDDEVDIALANLLKLLEKLGEKYGKEEQLAADDSKSKIKRDAFLYLENPDEPQFAQCGTCWLYGNYNCCILPDDFKVNPEDSCGYYLESSQGHVDYFMNKVKPEDVGFVKATKVRCENCKYGGDNKCKLFELLNLTFPEFFDLNENINPRGCCNAFQSAQ